MNNWRKNTEKIINNRAQIIQLPTRSLRSGSAEGINMV